MRIALLILLVACTGGSSTDVADAGPSPESSDGGSSGAVADAASSSSSDSGVTCGGPYDKTCAVALDCLMVAKGCYCGAQPIIGVSKTAQPAAQTCESQAEKSCALGCANAPGHVGEDGQNDEGTGKNLEVFCDNGQCRTRLEP